MLGEGADADHPLGLQGSDHDLQMLVASRVQGGCLASRKLVRRDVATLGKERQGTVVGDEVLGKKGRRTPEAFLEQAPKAPATDFRTRAGETLDRTLGILDRRALNGRVDSQPVAHGGDFTKWNPALHHAKRPRIHAKKDDSLVRRAVTSQVVFVRCPSVGQRIVDVADRRGETERVQRRRERQCSRSQRIGEG